MAKNGAVGQEQRLVAIDWMRGLVMVLMTLDHASGSFNAGRLFTDGVRLDRQPLPVADFLTRWVTHLCAPTFVFLAGTALALSVGRRMRTGERAGSIDRFIVVRGLIIVAFEAWMSLVFGHGRVLTLQVLYALGLSMVCMAALRRLSTPWLLALALVGWVVSEPLAAWAVSVTGPPGLAARLLFSGGEIGPHVRNGYPLFPWVWTMVLGFCFGRWLLDQPAEAQASRAARLLVACGLALLGLYLVLRGVNGPGNMALLRHDDSVVQWLHVSKYPPSLTFWGLELGLAALLLALAFRARLAWPPLVLFGQTALFYYLLHAHLLRAAAVLLGMDGRAGLVATYLSAVVVILVLYPLCRWYRGYKRAHPKGWPQYI
jgi:uncharacterized membrane protein